MKKFIIKLAEDAGNKALDFINKAEVSSKGHKSVVTEADIAVEKLILGRIQEKFPEHNIVTEESDNINKESDFTWYIDPIDGTANYAHGDPNYCVSIALAEKEQLKYACVNIPALNEIYYAEKDKGTELNGKEVTVSKIGKLSESQVQVGISPLKKSIDDSLKIFKHFMLHGGRAKDYGFCAGQLAYIASGKADALVKRSQHPWDIAAGILLIREAGGEVTDEKGNELKIDDTGRHHVVASNRKLHDTVLENLKTINVETKNEWYS